ncbi:homeobox protein 5 [Drosophila busckii]|uniref:homeobox protein 5 n=1 Tax=Drosophila busckii TaxID=30019 RepID=UPI00083EB372|nr:homeobox protein 5 [Drosophila busckii]XP_017852832.1 homeobox protein 5 [Drosophila busckii]XP_017852833.1 homeobox protein 5 [Drosophila busckii]
MSSASMMMMMSSAGLGASSAASTDCSSSSIQGSTASSASSDVMTLTTTAASSWCAMPASSRLRLVRLVRPHQRRLLMVSEQSASFGFAVRGGKEHGIGFFVSHVEHGGEAQLKGLRLGDQILRINGYRLEDAVHKEFIQLVGGQDRVTLKVRGVGMLPVKDQAEESLSWNVVKLSSVSGTPSESSFKATEGGRRSQQSSRDINVVLHVAPRTKLGLGICKGPEWKPGIFVQFTKERSVAREAGLRPGDQILSVNSIDFVDVLFSEAVAVMKSSSKLDMVVRTAAGCDLFPGESSGYNSSASSVTGDQSPCWADAKSKRLTAVREEPPPPSPPVNKTIIKLTENGTSINNTYIANGSSSSKTDPASASVSRSTTMRRSSQVAATAATTTATVAPVPPPLAANMASNPSSSSSSSSNAGNSSSLSSAIYEELKKRKEKQQQQQQAHRSSSSHLNRERDTDRDRVGDERTHNGNRSQVAQVSHKRAVAPAAAAPATTTAAAATAATTSTAATGGGDQHTALMDEFKRAHQRMFRNGFHESEHKERGETLKRTSIMPDDSCYRNSNNNNSSSNRNSNSSSNGSNRMSLLNGNNNNNSVNSTPDLPPPPPQFANPKQQQQQQQLKLSLAAGNGNGSRAKTLSPLSPVRNVGVALRAPASPLPDYDATAAVQLRSSSNGHAAATNGNQQQEQQRRTLRLGTVTIGGYEPRGKRETLRKQPSINGERVIQSNGILKNGNRNSASYNSSSSNSGSNTRPQQQQQQQHIEKSIKFGN